jgi:hypothetical protein
LVRWSFYLLLKQRFIHSEAVVLSPYHQRNLLVVVGENLFDTHKREHYSEGTLARCIGRRQESGEGSVPAAGSRPAHADNGGGGGLPPLRQLQALLSGGSLLISLVGSVVNVAWCSEHATGVSVVSDLLSVS